MLKNHKALVSVYLWLQSVPLEFDCWFDKIYCTQLQVIN